MIELQITRCGSYSTVCQIICIKQVYFFRLALISNIYLIYIILQNRLKRIIGYKINSTFIWRIFYHFPVWQKITITLFGYKRNIISFTNNSTTPQRFSSLFHKHSNSIVGSPWTSRSSGDSIAFHNRGKLHHRLFSIVRHLLNRRITRS